MEAAGIIKSSRDSSSKSMLAQHSHSNHMRRTSGARGSSTPRDVRRDSVNPLVSGASHVLPGSSISSVSFQHPNSHLPPEWTEGPPSESLGHGSRPSATFRTLLDTPGLAPPAPTNPPSTPNPPPPVSATSAWLQSVTNDTGNYVTSTISLSGSRQTAGGLVAHSTLSGVQVLGNDSNTGNGMFNNDASYTTSMQDLLYTLFVAVVLVTLLVVIHAGWWALEGSSFCMSCTVHDVRLKLCMKSPLQSKPEPRGLKQTRKNLVHQPDSRITYTQSSFQTIIARFWRFWTLWGQKLSLRTATPAHLPPINEQSLDI